MIIKQQRRLLIWFCFTTDFFFFGVKFCGVLPRWVSNELQNLIGLFLFICYYYFKKKKIHQHILMFFLFLNKMLFSPTDKRAAQGRSDDSRTQISAALRHRCGHHPRTSECTRRSPFSSTARDQNPWVFVDNISWRLVGWASSQPPPLRSEKVVFTRRPFKISSRLIGGPLLFSSNWSCGRWSGPALHPPLQTEWGRW